MRRRLTLLIVAPVLFASAAAAFAQVQPGQNDSSPDAALPGRTARFGNPTSTARTYQDYLYGVVKKIDKAELVLEKTKFGTDQTIKLGPRTKFLRDGKPSTLGEVKIGEDVFVETKKNKKSGEMLAKKVLTGAV